MNKKISQFELTNTLYDQDLITVVQSNENKNITVSGLTTSLSNTFSTNDELSTISSKVDSINIKVEDNYNDLSNKIEEGDAAVTNNVTSTVNSYYDVLNNKIIVLDEKHDKDMSEVNLTVQDWIDDIDNRSTVDQLHDALNRLTVAENTITSLAEVIANGGGSGSTPGYHTQSTATIFPLSGYYKGTDASPLATTDTLNQALSKLENQVEAISDNSGSLPVIKSGESTAPSDGTIYTSLKVKEDYLNKHGDTADGKVTFLKGIQGGSIFRSGWDGQGASLYPSNSKWNLELDNLFVRGNMTVNELTINEIKAVGGDILVTLADMECTQVDKLADCYRCYFDDADGTKYNQFVANDMAICQKFDGKNVKRYWRKVNNVGSNYIDLSLDVCEAGSAIPEADDKIIQLGHMYEQDEDYNKQMDERRNAIFISAKGINAPRISFYKNIDDFTLADSDGVVRERVVIGGDDTKFVGHIYQTSETGITRVPVYRGVWVQGNTYYYYDQVTHDGSLWICMKSSGTTMEPSDTEDDWQKQVSKGDAGKPSDDVAKWVEITGPRIFVYPDTTYTGQPTPTELNLIANDYGMTDPSYEWKLMDGSELVLSQSKYLRFLYTQFPSNKKEVVIRCTVTNNTGYYYYDDVQIAKIANGAEGADGYYIDLSNYNVTIPYYNDGSAKVDLSSAYTNVTAYKGSVVIGITNIVASTIEGTATTEIVGNNVKLTSLDSPLATIQLTITLSDGMVVLKNWYINNNSDGADGYNGEDAQYVYMSGEQYFHYSYTTTGSLVCNPSSITLTADAFNIISPKYKWYWSVAGSYDWQVLTNEVSKTLVVSPNGTYFSNNRKEISFKCEVYNDTASYFDFMTINKVYDGDTVYRATLQNESTTVPADENGKVTSYSSATTTTRLIYGSNEITDYTLSIKLKLGTGATFSVDNSTKTVKCTNIPNSVDTAIAEVSFTYNNTVVDKVDFVVTKVKTGKTGTTGSSSISIYKNSIDVPGKPTFTSRPTGTINGWSMDPVNSDITITWVSSNVIDANGVINGSNWTSPVAFSPLPGADGNGISSVGARYTSVVDGSTPSSTNTGQTNVPAESEGYNIYMRYYITYTNGTSAYTNWVRVTGFKGSTGDSGASLNFRGEYAVGKTYYWDNKTNARDVVKHDGVYYAVKTKNTYTSNVPTDTNYWMKFTTFENIATGLLFAEEGTIGGWVFNNGYMRSTNNLVGMCANISFSDAPSRPVLSIGGEVSGTYYYGFDSSTGLPSNNGLIKMYATGTILVGNNSSDSTKAGISGRSDSTMLTGTSNEGYQRFWAGSGRNIDGPFYVLDNGYLKASNANITGSLTANSIKCNSISGWKAPGIVAGYHVGKSRYSLFNLGYSIESFAPSANGGVFKHNCPYNCGLIYIPRVGTGDTYPLRGWLTVNSVIPYSSSNSSSGTVSVTCYDSEGTLHGMNTADTGVDVFLVSYN